MLTKIKKKKKKGYCKYYFNEGLFHRLFSRIEIIDEIKVELCLIFILQRLISKINILLTNI